MTNCVLKLLFCLSFSWVAVCLSVQAQPEVKSAWTITSLDQSSIYLPFAFTKPAIDSKGNMIMTGQITGNADLDSDGIIDVDAKEFGHLVVANFHPTGNLNWVFKAGETPPSFRAGNLGHAVITDDQDNIYLTGNVSGVTDFDGDGTNDFPPEDTLTYFMAKFSGNGHVSWVRKLESPPTGIFWHMLYDAANQGIYTVASHYDRCPDLYDNECTGSEFAGLHIQHYDLEGNLEWEHKTPLLPDASTSFLQPLGADVNSKGDLYVAGRFDGQVDFDEDDALVPLPQPFSISPITADTTYRSGAFFVRFGTSGEVRTQTSICQTGCYPIRLQIGVDQKDNFYLSNGITLQIEPDSSIAPHLTKFSANGQILWHRSFQSTGEYSAFFYGYGLDVDRLDRPHITGYAHGEMDIDEDGVEDISTFTNEITRNTLITPAVAARFSSDGTLDWIHKVWHDGYNTRVSRGYWITTTPNHGVYFIGEFQHSLDPDGPGPNPPLLQRAPYGDRFLIYLEEPSRVAIDTELQRAFSLTPPAPNPFRSKSTLSLNLETPQAIKIALYDMQGRRIQHIFQGTLPANTQHQFEIDGGHLPSGVYLYRITGQTFSRSGKVLLVK